MAPLDNLISVNSLGEFTFPMPHSTEILSLPSDSTSHSYSIGTPSVPATHQLSHSMTSSKLHGTVHKTLHVTVTIPVPTTTPTSENETSHSTLSMATISPSTPLHTVISTTSPTPVVSVTPVPAAAKSKSLSNEMISILAIVVAIVVLIVLGLCIAGFLQFRKYVARRKARKVAQTNIRQWYKWLKSDREQPWVATREPELTRASTIQSLSATSSTISGKGITVVTPLRNSLATTVGTWPIRSALPPPRWPFQGSDTSARTSSACASSIYTHDSVASFETSHGDIGLAFVHSDSDDLYWSPEEEDAKAHVTAHLRSSPLCHVPILEGGDRPVSQRASLVMENEDDLERVDLE